MVKVIGIRFKEAGKIYYFDPQGLDLRPGVKCVVETEKGLELGEVVTESKLVPESEVVQPLKKVMRIATPEDLEQQRKNKEKEKEAFKICLNKIRELDLPMKLVNAEYSFNGSKLVFSFTAEGRVDFRQLVRDLAYIFKTRIELRQIGVRDEAKILRGYGICGRPLCCTTFLKDFEPVSIRMAKEQDLTLNPVKISGACGRLMCCLMFEYEIYKELRQKLPKVGTKISTPEGEGKVKQVNVLKQTVVVQFEDGREVEYPRAELEKIGSQTK